MKSTSTFNPPTKENTEDFLFKACVPTINQWKAGGGFHTSFPATVAMKLVLQIITFTVVEKEIEPKGKQK